MSAITSSAINSQTPGGNFSLTLVQEPRISCVSRHQENEGDTTSDSQTTKHKENSPPALNSHIRASDGIHKQRADDLTDTIHRNPRSHADRVLAAPVPVGSDDDEGRGDGRLSETEEEAGGCETVEVLGAANGHFDAAPDDNGGANEDSDVKAGEDVCGRVLGGKLAEVKERYYPRELLASELEVGFQAEDGGIVNGALVEIW